MGAQCVELPGALSESARLADAVPLMREAIAFVADVDPEQVQIDEVRPILPEPLASEVARARHLVAELGDLQRQAVDASRGAVRSLRDAGVSGADVARVLGVSPQRVSQLAS